MLASTSQAQIELLDVPDPVAFLAENHVGFVVNIESLRQIEGHFNPVQFDPIKVAWVQHDGKLALRIVDGFTRTCFIARHGTEIRNQYPDFRFTAIDVTAGLLANPTIAELGADQRSVLTPGEYLRALIPPTVVHATIAAKRLAAYIAASWGDMVGEQIADRFSALAALWHLEHGGYSGKSGTPFFSGETESDHEIIERALNTIMKAIPSQLYGGRFDFRLSRPMMHLIIDRGIAIGGERNAEAQIYGLLFDIDVTEKINREAIHRNNKITTETLRAELAWCILKSLRALSVGNLSKILKDPQLNYPNMIRVLQNKNPRGAYHAWQHRRGAPPQQFIPSTVPQPQLTRVVDNAITAAQTLADVQPASAPVVPASLPQRRALPPVSTPTPTPSLACEHIKKACTTITNQIGEISWQESQDIDLLALASDVIKLLGRRCFNEPDLLELREKYKQLNQKYTHLLEQRTAER